MKVILFKLIKDFRFSLGKLLLMVLAASLSSWGIGSVMYSYFMTERDFGVNFLQTYPADITLIIDNYSSEMRELLLADPNVMAIERREVITARVRDKQGSWMPLVLYAVDDINNIDYDVFKILEDQALRSGQILVEKNAYFFLDENTDSLEVQFVGHEGTKKWKVSGKAHDARLAPARMEGVIYAYSTSINLVEPYLKHGRQRLLIKTNVSTEVKSLQSVSKRLKATINAQNGAVVSLDIPEPGKHIHQGIVDGIAFLQESGGGVLSIMGITLLSLILLTWLYPQVGDIGVMKSMGASTQNIFWSYLTVFILILLIGLVIGMPLGYQKAYLYNNLVAYFQNFEVVREILPIQFHITVAAIAITIPLLFGAIPLYRATKTTVNDAINKVFYTPYKGFVYMSNVLIKNVKLRYSANNLLRQSVRSLLIVMLISVGIGLYFTSENTAFSIRTDLDKFLSETKYDLGVLLPEKIGPDEIKFLDDIDKIISYETLCSENVSYLSPKASFSKSTFMRILDTNLEIPDEYLIRGEILPNCENCIYISGKEMEEDFESIELGSPIVITNALGEAIEYRLAGVFDNITSLSAPFIRFDTVAQKSFNYVVIEYVPSLNSDEILDLSNQIDDKFIEAGIDLKLRVSAKMQVQNIMNHLNPSFLIIKTLGIFAMALGFVGLLIVLNLTLKERTREIGIMKSLGAPSIKISGLFNLEFLVISIISVVIGALIATPVTKALTNLIAETIIRHPVAFKANYMIMILAVILIFMIQIIVITGYNHFKMRQNARELLDHNF